MSLMLNTSPTLTCIIVMFNALGHFKVASLFSALVKALVELPV